MEVFQDRTGRDWEIQLTVGGVMRVKAHCQIDIGDVISFAGGKTSGVLERLGEDSELLCKTIWMMCEKQAASAGISQEDFFDLLDGESVENAAQALIDEIINFSRPAQRKVLRKLRELSREAEKSLEKKLDTVLESKAFTEEFNGILNPSSGSSPESLA